jgi:hypothetical protein
VRRNLFRLFVIVSFFASVAPLFAHHSFTSEFDITQPVTLKGTLTKFDFVNPHGWIYVDVKGDDGKVVNWAIETGGPGALLRRGVRKDSFPIGVEVTVKGYRAKNGTPKANGASIKTADGRDYFLGSSGPNVPGGEPTN